MTPLEIAERLPHPDELLTRSRRLAVIEAVISPEWEWRYFSFDPAWAQGEQLASMRNGSGDQFFIVFTQSGTVVRVFDHESEMSPWGRDDGSLAPGLLEGFPDELRHIIDEPAFRTDGGPETDVTFCAWHRVQDGRWRVGSVTDDGGASYHLNALLDASPISYLRFVDDYYELKPDRQAIALVWAGDSLTHGLIARINPSADPVAALTEAESMGYPVLG